MKGTTGNMASKAVRLSCDRLIRPPTHKTTKTTTETEKFRVQVLDKVGRKETNIAVR